MDNTGLAKLLRKEVDENLQLFSSLWDGYHLPDNTLPPHRQRTTVNKLRGYALFLGIGSQHEPPTPGLQMLRSWQQELGTLRDLDVTLQWVETIRKKASYAGRRGAKALRDYLTELREERRQVIAAEAQGFRGAEIRLAVHQTAREFGQALETLEKRTTPFDDRAALRAVAKPWEAGLGKIKVNHGDINLHSFRVKNKKLRFVLELLAVYTKDTPKGKLYADRAATASSVHTTLGNLSDLLVVRDVLRSRRGKWMVEGRTLEKSADALEAVRLDLERAEFLNWFANWPKISQGNFVGDLLTN